MQMELEGQRISFSDGVFLTSRCQMKGCCGSEVRASEAVDYTEGGRSVSKLDVELHWL